MSKKITVYLEDRDLKLFEFLWHWKVASSAVLAARCFPNTSIEAAYNRMNRLKQGGYLAHVRLSSNDQRVWTLTKKSFPLVKYELPVRDDGFLSECPDHDFITLSFQLGDWLKKVPEGAELVTEQQLRRFHYYELPEWISNDLGLSEESKRMDGYWRIQKENKTWIVGIEVELNQKQRDRYMSQAVFYQSQPGLDRVIWLVKTLKFAKKLEEIFNSFQRRQGMHDFVLLDSFLKEGWQAKVVIGKEAGLTLATILKPRVSQGLAIDLQVACESMTSVYTDFRLKPEKLKAIAEVQNQEKL